MRAVILCGGSGTRLWPMSRKAFPKQFLNVDGSDTLLGATLDRVRAIDSSADLVLVTNEQHRFVVRDQLEKSSIASSRIFLEPVSRNTAAAIAICALDALDAGNDDLLLVLPADHVIKDVRAFCEAVERAVSLARNGYLVTFGITPDKAETGYGYLRAGAALEHGYRVDAFVEKPDAQTAEAYIRSGEYFWNSGMFLFKASSFIEELRRHAPDIHEAGRRAFDGAARDREFTRLPLAEFSSCRNESVDYAVMEKSDRVAMVPLCAHWSDIGSWAALWEARDKNAHGNVEIGDVTVHDSRNTYIHSSHRLVCAVGVDDLVIVETADALLVAHKDKVQGIKKLVSELEEASRAEVTSHRHVHRPWGEFDSIESGQRFQVKRIMVKPGAKLSLQMHHHRAEHWIVVVGTAKVTIDGNVTLLTENQSTYIPVGSVHSLENPGKIPLELIEVQSGAYLGEDDIVRFEDNYGRV